MRQRFRKPETKFGQWLLDNMMGYDYSTTDIANMLYTSRQNVYNHIIGKVKPQYVWVMAYCQIFNDDLEKIWKMVQEES